MGEAVNVGWAYIRYMLNRSTNPLMNLMLMWLAERSRCIQWWRLKRNAQVALAHYLTVESHTEEMTDISEEALRGQTGAHDTVRRALTSPMKDVMVQSRACLSEGIMKQDPAMFRIFEHILFARLVVAQQAEILKELAEEGCIDESELEHFSRNLIEPAQVALK